MKKLTCLLVLFVGLGFAAKSEAKEKRVVESPIGGPMEWRAYLGPVVGGAAGRWDGASVFAGGGIELDWMFWTRPGGRWALNILPITVLIGGRWGSEDAHTYEGLRIPAKKFGGPTLAVEFQSRWIEIGYRPSPDKNWWLMFSSPTGGTIGGMTAPSSLS